MEKFPTVWDLAVDVVLGKVMWEKEGLGRGEPSQV